MRRSNYKASDSRIWTSKNAVHMDTIFATFRYPATMAVGTVGKIEKEFEIKHIGYRHFTFLMKKTTEEFVSIICERRVDNQTLKSRSAVEEDALEADERCFLRFYFSVIGVNEKPKCAVMRSTDTSASVEFAEASFLKPKVFANYIYTLKCVVRRIETSILLNKEQDLMWEECVRSSCKSEMQKNDMAYVLKRANLVGVFTGRRNALDFLTKSVIFRRACCISYELVQYFSAKENSNPVPPTVNLGMILGYLMYGFNIVIPLSVCLSLYWDAMSEGMTFLKDLCTTYIIENLDEYIVIDVLKRADLAEDARLFNAAWLFCLKNGLRIFQSHKWKRNDLYNLQRLQSIVHGFSLRLEDSFGFPPALEDESGLETFI